jgi:hypothetical protein
MTLMFNQLYFSNHIIAIKTEVIFKKKLIILNIATVIFRFYIA